MNVSECDECGKDFPASKSKNGMCFSCWIGVGSPGPYVEWRGGGGYGRENFHERTNADFLRENDGPGTRGV